MEDYVNLSNQKPKLLKKQKLRNNEYYDMQKVYDKLYQQSLDKCKFKNLYNIIISKQNILLAYRNIKVNKGSMTVGTDNENIENYQKLTSDELVELVRNKLIDYKPRSVRRVFIPKPNGKTRPLGIPCFIDRIIQQSILQVLEPICEAKFFKHSYGFRPNRSTKHAYARVASLTNKTKMKYCVDIDIQGFFDNVNHGKLLKQIWHLGIQDKRIISIISKMLKAEIKGEGIPTKGTPQGGILSPLLSNIVLNELDWWVANQWENFPSQHHYRQCHKFRALKSSKLKEVWIVRYADDFKLFCKDRRTADIMYHATIKWLRERLHLEVSQDKSKITNLRKNYSDFLGFRFMLKDKGKTEVLQSRVSIKAVENIKSKLTKQIAYMQRHATPSEVNKYNAMVFGVQSYYNTATNVTVDFDKIHYVVQRKLFNRIGRFMKISNTKTKTYQRLYPQSKVKAKTFAGVEIYPIGTVRNKPPMCFSPETCNFTKVGRKKIHETLTGLDNTIEYLLRVATKYNSVQLVDNMISLYAGQKGKCAITKLRLIPNNMELHHKTPKELGGTDDYSNLVWITNEVHKLVHCTDENKIQGYLQKGLITNDTTLKKINKLRELVGNSKI